MSPSQLYVWTLVGLAWTITQNVVSSSPLPANTGAQIPRAQTSSHLVDTELRWRASGIRGVGGYMEPTLAPTLAPTAAPTKPHSTLPSSTVTMATVSAVGGHSQRVAMTSATSATRHYNFVPTLAPTLAPTMAPTYPHRLLQSSTVDSLAHLLSSFSALGSTQEHSGPSSPISHVRLHDSDQVASTTSSVASTQHHYKFVPTLAPTIAPTIAPTKPAWVLHPTTDVTDATTEPTTTSPTPKSDIETVSPTNSVSVTKHYEYVPTLAPTLAPTMAPTYPPGVSHVSHNVGLDSNAQSTKDHDTAEPTRVHSTQPTDSLTVLSVGIHSGTPRYKFIPTLAPSIAPTLAPTYPPWYNKVAVGRRQVSDAGDDPVHSFVSEPTESEVLP